VCSERNGATAETFNIIAFSPAVIFSTGNHSIIVEFRAEHSRACVCVYFIKNGKELCN
jgi:hypothetical protein